MSLFKTVEGDDLAEGGPAPPIPSDGPAAGGRRPRGTAPAVGEVSGGAPRAARRAIKCG